MRRPDAFACAATAAVTVILALPGAARAQKAEQDGSTAFERAQAAAASVPPTKPDTYALEKKREEDAKAVVVSRATLRMLPFFGRLGFQAGASRPFGPAINANGERPWTVLGLTYRLQSPGKRALIQPDLYVDFGNNAGDTRQASSFFEAGQGRSFWGIGTSVRAVAYFLRGSAAAYTGAGAGVYRVETSRRFELYNATGSTVSSQPTAMAFRPGGKLFAGLTHRSGVYLEAAWHDAGSLNGRRYSGLVYALGFRR
jgi:hypothetical protein